MADVKGFIQAAPNTACSRLALRAEFQSFFRVVIVLRGARVMCRNRQAADAYVRHLKGQA